MPGAITWSKLVQLGVLLSFLCWFLSKRFRTLKIESDFFRAKDTEHLFEQVSTRAINLNKNNDGRLSFFFKVGYNYIGIALTLFLKIESYTHLN